jgi:hypothetical protein
MEEKVSKQKFSKILAVPITGKMKVELQALADAEFDGNVSALVREILKRWIYVAVYTKTQETKND